VRLLKVELLQITPNAEEFIGRCASICYDSSTEPSACIKRASACVSKGHLATLRFAHATFHISDISRTCSHQFVRSKHLDFLQRSQRYCKEEDPSFVYPKDFIQFDIIYETAVQAYNDLISRGVKKEDARYVLPQGVCTELNVTGNLQAWKDFIDLRSGPEVQGEIRMVAKEINNILTKECPNIFKEIE
jgi:thymidylate synthase (FAD)